MYGFSETSPSTLNFQSKLESLKSKLKPGTGNINNERRLPMISRIDHVSIAVKDFDKARNFFTKILGAIPGSKGDDETMKFYWEIYSMGDLSRIELITPTGTGSFIDSFLENREGACHHITLQVPDILKAKDRLKEYNIPYFDGKDYGEEWKEIFIHPKNAFGVLIQLSEFVARDWLSDSVKLPDGRKWQLDKNDTGCSIEFSHPGGGTATLNLSKNEIKKLIQDLENTV